MRRLGDELRLVSRGYLELRLQVSELQTGHSNLLKELSSSCQGTEAARVPRFVKFAIDDARRSRLKQQMPQALADVRALEALRSSPEEHALLNQLRARLRAHRGGVPRRRGAVRRGLRAHRRPRRLAAAIPSARRRRRERLLRARAERSSATCRNLSAELRLRAQQAALRLEEEENRAVWATLLLAVIAVAGRRRR